MTIQRQGIPLPANCNFQPAGSAVKSVALATFRFLRASGAQAQKVPGLLQQAGIDIAEAWQESAGPNL